MRLVPYHQRLVSAPLADVALATRRRLDALGFEPPRGRVAVTGGSRGIDQIAAVLRACGDWLRDHGADPFVVPAMGSHNGATPQGQRTMLEGLGMTEEALGMPIESSMDVVSVGKVAIGPAAGADVWMDRLAAESAGVLVVNRVKPHTSFGGAPYGEFAESGLTKMMTVGLGKLEGARVFHAIGTSDKPLALRGLGKAVIASGKVWAGLAIVEDGYDRVAELHALAASRIVADEPALLGHYATNYFPRLPIDELNVLVIDTIGKNFSGTGMDTNVVGRRGLEDAPDPPLPRIGSIAALGLSPESYGNAVGVGLADVITQRLYDAIDLPKTLLNAQTAGGPKKAAIPLVMPDEAAVFTWLRERHGERRWMRVPNTLHLGSVLVSEDLLAELPPFQE
ncbi:MAG: lactate racemase domain-containing protein [Lacipirellulaceae bacterium]